MLTARHGKIVNSDVYGVTGSRRRDTAHARHHLPHLLDDQADHRRRDDDAVRGRQVEAEDPLSKYIPEFADLKVMRDGMPTASHPQGARAPADCRRADVAHGRVHLRLLRQLARSTSCIWPRTRSTPRACTTSSTKLAKLPLVYQPGEEWQYSISVDVQGYLVEKLSGSRCPTSCAQRIFEPLGMVDTGFAVPEASSRAGHRLRIRRRRRIDLLRGRDPNVTKMPGMASGGGGLYSTADDYLRFAQMLLNGGQLDGVRLLAPGTVALMRDNQLPDRLRDGRFGIGVQRMRPGFGFGYDVAVFDDPHKAGSTTGKGTFLWDGAAGTWFWIDPANDIVFVAMIQRFSPPASPISSTCRACSSIRRWWIRPK